MEAFSSLTDEFWVKVVAKELLARQLEVCTGELLLQLYNGVNKGEFGKEKEKEK